MIDQIETVKASLRKSERKVAEVVLARPNIVSNMSMADLAQQAGVSPPTVMRFCRAVGCKGFQDLKMRLITDLARHVPSVHRDFRSDDKASELAGKLIERTVSSLMRLKQKLDGQKLEQAIDILVRAHRIEFYGQGAFGQVAADACDKFYRLGIPCAATVDPYKQILTASLLKKGAVIIAFSSSGQNIPLLNAVKAGRQSGLEIIAITNKHTPLARLATITLDVDIAEDIQLHTPMTTRLMHLLIADMLQVGTSLRMGPKTNHNLERARRNYYEMPGMREKEHDA